MQTFETVCRLLHKVKDLPDTTMTMDAQLQLDPLDMAELIMEVEEEFNVLIEDEACLKTLGDLVALVEAQAEVA